MLLCEGAVGKLYRVKKMHLALQTERRLEALGLTGGATIEIKNRKRHGAVIMKLRGTRFAIGKGIAQSIEIEEAGA